MEYLAVCWLLAAVAGLLSGCGPSAPSPGEGPKTRGPTTTVTTTHASPPCVSENPFECNPYYVNPVNAKEYEKSISTATGQVKDNLKIMQHVPSAYWIDQYQKIRGESLLTVEGVLKDAASKLLPELVVFIWYDLPNRDCDAKASLGQICCTKKDDGTCDFVAEGNCSEGIHEYKTKYTDTFISVLQEYQDIVPIVIIFEPDGLGNLATNLKHAHCGNMATQAAYRKGAQYAVGQIATKTPKVHLYLDAGHGGWLGWTHNMDLFLKMLKSLDLPWHRIRGFATNTANYQPLGMQCPWCPDSGYRNGYCLAGKHKDDPCCIDPCGLSKQYNAGHTELNYAAFLAAAAVEELGFQPHMIIDTGRNGVPDMRESCSSWCNPRGAGAGLPSTSETANKSLVDAYFWLKTPGESDGCTETLPSGKRCPRYDPGCGSAGALGSKDDEEHAPEAGAWYDFQVKQLAENARFNDTSVDDIPAFRDDYEDATCPFELKPGQKASDFNFTTSDGDYPCSGLAKQCGGAGWFGPQCCAGTCVCEAEDKYNSLCKPKKGHNDCGNLTKIVVQAYDERKALPGATRPNPTSEGATAAAAALLRHAALLASALLSLTAVGGFLRGLVWLRRRSRRPHPSDTEVPGSRSLGLYETLNVSSAVSAQTGRAAGEQPV